MDSKGKNSGLPAFGARQTTVFAMCFLVTLLAYVDRVGFSVAFTKLSAAAGQDQTAKGAILSSFYYGYATSQIPCAWFASRFALHLRPLHPCPEPAALVLLTTSTCPTALPSSPLTLTSFRFGGVRMLAASMVLSTLAALATPSDATQFVRLCCCRAAVGVAQVRSSGPFPPHHAPRIAIPRPHTAPRPAPPSSPPSPLPVDLPHTGRRIAASEVTLIEFSLSKGLVVIEPVWGPLSQRVHAGTCASQTTFQHRLSALKRRGRGRRAGRHLPVHSHRAGQVEGGHRSAVVQHGGEHHYVRHVPGLRRCDAGAAGRGGGGSLARVPAAGVYSNSISQGRLAHESRQNQSMSPRSHTDVQVLLGLLWLGGWVGINSSVFLSKAVALDADSAFDKAEKAANPCVEAPAAAVAIPWARLLSTPAIWALIVNNFAFHYVVRTAAREGEWRLQGRPSEGETTLWREMRRGVRGHVGPPRTPTRCPVSRALPTAGVRVNGVAADVLRKRAQDGLGQQHGAELRAVPSDVHLLQPVRRDCGSPHREAGRARGPRAQAAQYRR
jgi:hypothetical protein